MRKDRNLRLLLSYSLASLFSTFTLDEPQLASVAADYRTSGSAKVKRLGDAESSEQVRRAGDVCPRHRALINRKRSLEGE